MTQPTIASFFGGAKKPAASSSSSNKRPLEQEGNEGSADAAAAQAQPSKKPAVAAAAASASAAASTAKGLKAATASLPSEVAAHPVMQPVAAGGTMDEGWRQVVLAEAGKPYFGRLLQFLSQEAKSKQARAVPCRAVSCRAGLHACLAVALAL